MTRIVTTLELKAGQRWRHRSTGVISTLIEISADGHVRIRRSSYHTDQVVSRTTLRNEYDLLVPGGQIG